MGKRFVFLIFVPMLIFTACIIWFIALPKQHPQLENAVKEAVALKQEFIVLADYGEWEEMYMFGPYTTNEMVEEKLGRRFRGPSLAWDELNFLLVLVDTKKSVRYALLPRRHRAYITTDYSLNYESGEIIITNINIP